MSKAPIKKDIPENEGATVEMVKEEVLVVTAPGGPRRRAGFAFGPGPVTLRKSDLGENEEKAKEILDLLRADPLLKLDYSQAEFPAED